MDVEDALPDAGAGVEDRAEVGQALLRGERADPGEQPAGGLGSRPRSAMSVKCSRGTTSTCVGACGLMSAKA